MRHLNLLKGGTASKTPVQRGSEEVERLRIVKLQLKRSVVVTPLETLNGEWGRGGRSEKKKKEEGIKTLQHRRV